MKTVNRNWNLSILNRRKEKINPRPQYQRTAVWSEKKKQLLIDSILRGYDIPKFYLRAVGDGLFEHEVVDGQQRLRAIWSFYANEYCLGEESNDLPDGDLSSLKHSELSAAVQDRFDLFEAAIVEIEQASELEIRDLFLRLQEGVQLNPAERRNAMPGGMRDFVAGLAEEMKVFALTGIKSTRMNHHDLAAHITCLALAKGPTDIKAVDLKKMYENQSDFKVNSAVANSIKKTLRYMARILKDSPPEMDIKWGFVDLFLLVYVLDKEYVIKGYENQICGFFIGFEQERREHIQDPSQLLEGDSDSWQRDLYNYIVAFQTGV